MNQQNCHLIEIIKYSRISILSYQIWITRVTTKWCRVDWFFFYIIFIEIVIQTISRYEYYQYFNKIKINIRHDFVIHQFLFVFLDNLLEYLYSKFYFAKIRIESIIFFLFNDIYFLFCKLFFFFVNFSNRVIYFAIIVFQHISRRFSYFACWFRKKIFFILNSNLIWTLTFFFFFF